MPGAAPDEALSLPEAVLDKAIDFDKQAAASDEALGLPEALEDQAVTFDGLFDAYVREEPGSVLADEPGGEGLSQVAPVASPCKLFGKEINP